MPIRLEVGGKTEARRARCELQKMKDYEAEKDQAAHQHGARSGRGADILFYRVLFRTRLPVFNREFDRGDDVQAETRQQKCADDPKQRSHAVQLLAIPVDLLGADEDLQVADEVTDYISDQYQAGEGDDPLFAD